MRKQKRISFRLSDEDFAKLKAFSKKIKKSISDSLRVIINSYLD